MWSRRRRCGLPADRQAKRQRPGSGDNARRDAKTV